MDNMLMKPEDVRVNFTVENQSLGSVLKFLCQSAGLKYKIDDSAVVIAAKDIPFGEMETRVFPVDADEVAPMGSDEASIMQYLKQNGVSWPYGSTLLYNTRSSRLSVTNTEENLEQTRMLIHEVQQENEPLVMIMIKFVEVRETNLKELGFDLTLSRTVDSTNPQNGMLEFGPNDLLLRNATSLSSDTELKNKMVSFTSELSDGWSYSAQVNALNQLAGQDVLASPRVTTLNNVTATISMVKWYPVPDYSDDGGDSGGGYKIFISNGSNGVQQIGYSYTSVHPDGWDYEDYGIALTVTPQIDPVNKRAVHLNNLAPRVTALVGWDAFLLNDDDDEDDSDVKPLLDMLPKMYYYKPIVTDRSVEDSVVVNDGNTIVLGGMVLDEFRSIDDKVPVLGDIPLVGRLFQSKASQNVKVNLLVFLTVKLIRPDGTAFYPQPENGLPDLAPYW